MSSGNIPGHFDLSTSDGSKEHDNDENFGFALVLPMDTLSSSSAGSFGRSFHDDDGGDDSDDEDGNDGKFEDRDGKGGLPWCGMGGNGIWDDCNYGAEKRGDDGKDEHNRADLEDASCKENEDGSSGNN